MYKIRALYKTSCYTSFIATIKDELERILKRHNMMKFCFINV